MCTPRRYSIVLSVNVDRTRYFQDVKSDPLATELSLQCGNERCNIRVAYIIHSVNIVLLCSSYLLEITNNYSSFLWVLGGYFTLGHQPYVTQINFNFDLS